MTDSNTQKRGWENQHSELLKHITTCSLFLMSSLLIKNYKTLKTNKSMTHISGGKTSHKNHNKVQMSCLTDKDIKAAIQTTFKN